MNQADLARLASVPRDDVVDFELGSRVPQEVDLAVVLKALEMAGAVFLEEDGQSGPGPD